MWVGPFPLGEKFVKNTFILQDFNGENIAIAMLLGGLSNIFIQTDSTWVHLHCKYSVCSIKVVGLKSVISVWREIYLAYVNKERIHGPVDKGTRGLFLVPYREGTTPNWS